MSIEYLDLVDYLAIAVEITGLSVETITRVAKLDLADSALHAPAAGLGDTEFYPEFIDKAAVLAVRLREESSAAGREQARRPGDAPTVHRDQRLEVGNDTER